MNNNNVINIKILYSLLVIDVEYGFVSPKKLKHLTHIHFIF